MGFNTQRAESEFGAPRMIPRTKREYLHELVTEKNEWNRPLTDGEKALGFLGWHQRGYLPHCDYPDMVQFVTFRLADSMPASRRSEWEHLLVIENDREKRKKLEEYLDRGAGECQLRDSRIATMMEEALLHFHAVRYQLLAWCVMPNHIHLLVHVWETPLWKLMQTWKRHVAATAGRTVSLERRTPIRRVNSSFWERDYWDTFMRDEKQERTAIRYIENNPVKSHLCKAPKDWLFSSARFRDSYGRLVVPGSSAVHRMAMDETEDNNAPNRSSALQ
jgi:putative transposase